MMEKDNYIMNLVSYSWIEKPFKGIQTIEKKVTEKVKKDLSD